ncbi:uncharacterized protein [Haliotis cracherodii]|uniref:uncharacterized protein n=1 Tax=Haliotis cracherodii TaxID=6455 RepID=UPI0039E7438B
MSHRRKSARPTNKHWRNGPHTFDHSPTQSACEDEGEDRSPPAADPGQAIEIPSDIFKDFQQLKHATNLDTTTLMRNLLNDYHRLPARSSWHRPLVEEEEQKSPPPTVVDDKQVMRDSSERGMFDMDMNRSSPLVDSGFIDHGCDSPFGTGTDQPLDLSVVVKSERSTPESAIGPQDKKTLVGQLQRKLIGGDRSPASPTVSSSPCVMMTSDVIMSHVSSQGGLVMTSAMPNQCRVVMSSAVPGSGTFTLSGDKNECNIMMPVQMSMQLPTVTNVDGGQGVMTSNINVETSSGQQIVAIPFLQTVPAVQVQAAPKSQLQPQSQPQPQQQLQQFQLQQQQQPQQPQPQPHVPARRGRKPGSVNKGNKASKPVRSNEMKVVAENTMFPGVYTSILKLPWSRRSRSKAHPPAPPVPPPTQPSMTLLPVTSSQDIATSESTLATSATHSPSTTQSVMMVYPNATISALGKPVRKRGRPPKLPVLSHLLAEKKPKKDSLYTPVATTLPSQSASISADGSMLSILSTHSIGADTSTEDDKLKKLQTVPESQDSKSFHPDQFPAPTTQPLETPDQGTATTKGSNGAMFQEMLLSSKSLINIKPRKRQSSNLIKSGENFICTSFRIRPRGSRHKAPTDSPKAGLPQAPPEPVPAPPVSTDINNASPVPQTEPLERVTVSPTSTVDDSPLSKNMFHELYHCKVCNEIVPADEKQTHKQQHVPVKFFCLTCGLEYYSFLQGKAGEDPDAPQSFQCERCSENYNSNLPLSSGLHLKTESLQCDVCDEQLKSFSDLCEHRREVHGDEKKGIDNYRCDECGKVFFTEKSLDAHRETHEEKEEEYCEEEMNPEELELAKEFSSKKEYTCVYDGCKKKFMKKFHLQEHIRVKHFNIRAYRCSWPGCYKEFAAERHLKVHLLIHKDEKPLKCDFCDYRCRQRNAMNWHMRKHPEAPYRYRKFGMLSGGDD